MLYHEKIVLALMIFLILPIGRIQIYANSPAPLLNSNQGLATVETPDGFTIFAELAITPDQRTKGLMYRTQLAPNRGMLFPFSKEGYWIFWMKNTKMALDILWLDNKGIIVYVKRNAPICTRKDNLCPRYRPTSPAVSVLELGAGQAEKLSLAIGSKLNIQLP